MKVAVIVNPGLEKLAQQELKEKFKVKAVVNSSLLSFEFEQKELEKLTKLQAVKRVILPFGEVIGEKVSFDKFSFNDYFKEEIKLKIEVENVKGQDNRIEIAKKITEQLFPLLEENKIKTKIDYKKPDHLVIVYDTKEKLVFGLDYTGRELNLRDYRVFAHSASFKGDLAYYFVRKAGFQKNEKLLSGFCKDGAIAIEAALFSPESEIEAFDSGIANVNAAKKNAKLAKVDLKINKYSFEDLDLKYGKETFDRVIFQVTTKDEVHLNEIYYQANYILKTKGTLFLIGRKNWAVTIPQKFKLLKEEELLWGESIHKMWLLEKK
ncbi:MAG: methyltransferase [Nanoarchaeota archaeon]|nr:methyltransferase [Nanoarchaeota archaeon]MBU1623206.1 methyltransferase [Nanoarchaeota archaeon]MBU1974206.1 methyltransferase [Nanoarchaeota archaeon]